MQIDPHKRGELPKVDPPVAFQSKDCQINGWYVVLPGQRPLATPAVVGGRVFLGGGFGSYEFYSFDAQSGNLLWQYQTSDDGPTAAVVHDDYVVFNTESCELEVLTVEGQPVWKHWLGDPLMSMPAVENGRVFMAFPDSRGDHQHYLACFELTTGKEYWKTPISGEIITAPVLAEECVYLATLDGTLYCFEQDDGQLVWHEQKNATSSPVVANRECYFSQREETIHPTKAATQQTEHCARRATAAGAATRPYRSTSSPANYLDYVKRKMGSAQFAAYAKFDAAVGFAGGKGDAKIAQAMRNLGHGHVSGIWAYQGSKPFLSGRCLFSALGDTLHCVDVETEEVYWTKKLFETDDDSELLDNVLTPPVVVNGKIFVGSVVGVLYCISADTGGEFWRVSIGEPIAFQPAAAQGRVYVSTSSGRLYCLETGDPGDDGWLMWGATGAHNGLPEQVLQGV